MRCGAGALARALPKEKLSSAGSRVSPARVHSGGAGPSAAAVQQAVLAGQPVGQGVLVCLQLGHHNVVVASHHLDILRDGRQAQQQQRRA